MDDVVIAEAPVPVTLAAPTPVSGTRVDLSWSASSAPDFAAYRIYRAMTPGTPWQQAHFVGEITSSGSTTWSDMTVGPKSTYYYQVLVLTQTGLSAAGNQAAVTTLIGVAYPFLDNGEGGGGLWTADAPWALSTEQFQSPTHAWSDSPGGNYSNGIPSQALTLAFPVNLSGSGALLPALGYRHNYALGGGDSVNVEISVNDGADWTTLANYTGTASGWLNGWHDLRSYAAQTSVLVRFRLTSDAGNSPGDGWHLDDIALCEQPLALPAPTVVSVNRQAIELSWPAYTGLDFHHYAIYRASTAAVGINDTLVGTITVPATTTLTDSAVILDTDYYYRVFVVNGFGVHSAPSAAAALARARSLPVRPGYTNDFETALGPEWVTHGAWARSDDSAHGGTFSFTDSPGGNYAPNSDTATSITLDLTGTYWPVLRFWHKYQFGSGDWGSIERSTDGVNWTSLVSFGGDAPLWAEAGIDLSQWKNQSDLRLRFRVVSDSGVETGDGWRIDDLKVEDHVGGLVSLPLVEGVEAGLGDWITDWQLDPATPHEGTNAVRSIAGDTGYATSYLTYGREVAVPTGTDHYLSFWVRDTSASDGSSYWAYYYGRYNTPYVDVSQDGGVTWATPFSEYDDTIPEIWSVRQVSLAAYKGQTIRVRFRHYNTYPAYGNFVVDYVGIGAENPSAPLLHSPADFTITDQQRPILTVRNAVDPQGDQIMSYRFEVYRDATLTNLVAQVPVVAEGAVTTSWQVDVDLPFEDQYWWRARAVDLKGNISDWMTTATFLVSASNQPPAAPEIVRPVEGEILDSLNELMAWYPAVDPNQGDAIVAYHIQIDTHADFSAPLVDALNVTSPIEQSPGTGSPAVALVMPLADLAGTNSLPTGTALYWRVRARDRFFAWSGWSIAESFSVATSPGQAYGHWRQRQFNAVERADPLVSGPAASPRGDGVANFLKYAFNMDPNVAASGPGRVLTPGTGTSGLPYTGLANSGGSHLRVEYVRRRNADDVL